MSLTGRKNQKEDESKGRRLRGQKNQKNSEILLNKNNKCLFSYL